MKQRFVFLILAVLMMAWAVIALPRPEQTELVPLAPITLAVAADTHYLAPELTDGGAYFTRIVQNGDGKAMLYCEEITEAFVTQIAAQKPAALLLAGDLTFNGAQASHEALTGRLQDIEDAGIPVLVIPGNHDLENPMAAAFRGDAYTRIKSVSRQEFAEIYAAFGYDEALSRDDASLSYTYALSPGLWALMLDVNTVNAPGALTEETFQWLRGQLEAARRSGARVVAVSHQNLLAHNSLFTEDYRIENGESLLKVYEQFDVLCNLSGHMHVQHISESMAGLVEIVTSSLVTAPFQYGILRLDDSAADYSVRHLTFPHEAEAAQFFWDTSCRKASELLLTSDEPPCRWFADVNSAYFAGRGDQIEWEDASYQEIRERSAFLGIYLQSIRDDGFRDHTKARLSLGD